MPKFSTKHILEGLYKEDIVCFNFILIACRDVHLRRSINANTNDTRMIKRSTQIFTFDELSNVRIAAQH
ncbi:hypothetical protein Glove_29g161 [Diversispora epigaea]|uniref:Uncharacterized protein n=1 Tax=Diversispora epigaea TaxID=1348612 RepID=A0A397JIL2_9GLOM|nr:hypothetical protein Glove_29g161 [Diversispora epigaea]